MAGIVDRLQSAGFSDDEIATTSTQLRSTLSAAGFPDDEIDQTLGGPKMPVPPAFLERVRRGLSVNGLFNEIGKAGVDTFKTQAMAPPISPETESWARDVGLFNKPGEASPIRTFNETLARGSASAFALMGAAFGAGVSELGAGVGGISRRLGISETQSEAARRETENLANFVVADSMARGGHAPLTRIERTPTGEVHDVAIGAMPGPSDFADAARAVVATPAPIAEVRAKIEALWQEHGIHPAEVAHDATIDPTISQDLASVGKELPQAYVAPAAQPTPGAPPLRDYMADYEANQARDGSTALPTMPELPQTPSATPQLRSFSPTDLRVDPQRFQFKEAGDSEGVSERLRGVEQWDPIKAGLGIVYEDADGASWIVDGHQRLALAKRISETDPTQRPRLNAWTLRAADGVTDADARAVAAAKNIAEGTGSPVDAAKVLRDRPDLLPTLPPRSELVRQAQGLMSLDPEAFGKVVNGVVPANHAAIVGRLVPDDPKMQNALVDLLAKTSPDNAVQAESIVRQGLDAGLHTDTQATLFGDQDVVSSLYGERARILDRTLRQLRRDRGVFRSIVDNRVIIEELGNRLAQDENARQATTDGYAVQILQTLANRRGGIGDSLTAVARSVADGSASRDAATRDFVAEIRRQAASGDLARLADGGSAGALAAPSEGQAGARAAAAEHGARDVGPAEEARAEIKVSQAIFYRKAAGYEPGEPPPIALPAPEALQHPPIPQGHVRLYRVEGGEPGTPIPDWVKESDAYKDTLAATGRWYTNDFHELEFYQRERGAGHKIVYVDVPAAKAEEYRVSNIPLDVSNALGLTRLRSENPAFYSARPEKEFFLPSDVAAGKADLPPSPMAEKTPQGEQLVIPGAERSAVQAAAGREAEGHGRIAPKGEQKEPGELFATPEPEEKGLFEEGGNGRSGTISGTPPPIRDTLTERVREAQAEEADRQRRRVAGDREIAYEDAIHDLLNRRVVDTPAGLRGVGVGAGRVLTNAEILAELRRDFPERFPDQNVSAPEVSLAPQSGRFERGRDYGTQLTLLEDAATYEAAGGDKGIIARLMSDEGGALRLRRLRSGLTPAEESIRGTIDFDPKRASQWSWSRLYTQTMDKLNPVPSRGPIGEELPTSQNPYQLMRLLAGSPGRAEGWLKYGQRDFATGDRIGPGMREILAAVQGDLERFDIFATSVRALELDKRGIETGKDVSAAAQVAADGLDRYGPTLARLIQYQDNLAKYLRDSGVLSREGYAAMREANQLYVPFYRVFADEEIGQIGGGGSLQPQNPINRIKGSERQTVPALESIMRNTYVYITQAERNVASTALVDLLRLESDAHGAIRDVSESHPRDTAATPPKFPSTPPSPAILPEQAASRPDLFPERGPVAPDIPAAARPVEDVTEVGVADAIRALLADHGISDDLFDFVASSVPPAEGQVRIFRDGKPETWQVGTDIARAVKALDQDSVNLLTRILAPGARLLRAGATLSPDFLLRNPIRDFFSAIVNTTTGVFTPMRTARGLASAVIKDENFQRWLDGGGGNASLVSMDRRYLQESLRDLNQATGLMNRTWNVVRHPIDALRMMSELSEQATRVGEFRAVRERELAAGASEKEAAQTAAFASREVTVDFARIGASMRSMNMATAFFNASLQGVDRLARAFRDDPLGTGVKVAGGITAPSVALWLVNHDDPDYQELPAWERDLFWIVPVGSAAPSPLRVAQAQERGETPKSSAKFYFRIPKPFELGVLFGSGVERLLDAYVAERPDAAADFVKSVMGALVPSIVPTELLPVAEQWANRSLFTDRNLIPKSLETQLPEYQYQPYTTETTKKLGQIIAAFPGLREASVGGGPLGEMAGGVARGLTTPILMENYLRGWTGGLGGYALQLADAGLRKSGLVPDPPKPADTLADIPVVKAFVVRHPSGGAESIQRFYDDYTRNKRYFDSWMAKAQEGDAAALTRIQEAGGPRLFVQLDSVSQTLGEHSKLVRDIWKEPEIPPEEKRQLIDQLYFAEIQIAQAGRAMMLATDKALATEAAR